jgi:hypothetical protein
MLPVVNDLIDIHCDNETVARFKVITIDASRQVFTLHLMEVRKEVAKDGGAA